MKRALESPIVFIVFNREGVTRQVFQQIRAARPKRLIVIADGPRPGNDQDPSKCESVRAIFNEIDWDCEFQTNFADQNLGIRHRIASGLTWAFQHVDEAIVLEDDCVPHADFFLYCQEMLDRYRNDTRIMAITGNNFQHGIQRTEHSYYFSAFPHCWGWATWARAWSFYDDRMTDWPTLRNSRLLPNKLIRWKYVKYWRTIFNACHCEELSSSWAYRFTFACWAQNALTVTPSRNLVSNIGFGSEASHTTDAKDFRANLESHALDFPLRHPTGVIQDIQADQYVMKKHFGVNHVSLAWNAARSYLAKKLIRPSDGDDSTMERN